MEYFVAGLIPIIAAAIVILLAKRIASHSFECKHCAGQFRIQWPRVIITEHSGNEYKLVCPHCQTKGWCIARPKER